MKYFKKIEGEKVYLSPMNMDDILTNVKWIHQSAEVGIFIGEAENRLKGYGSEALKLLVFYGFNYLNFNNIMLKVFSFNDVAISAYKKVGFNEFGSRKKSYYLKGKWYDDIYMEILREDYFKD